MVKNSDFIKSLRVETLVNVFFLLYLLRDILKYMNILITGGAGFVGSALIHQLYKQGHTIIVVDIKIPPKKIIGVNYLVLDLIKESLPDDLNPIDAIIHLAGAPIFNKWTPAYKQLIIDSRIKTAQALFNYFKDKQQRPHTFISASAIGYYGDTGENVVNEKSSFGSDFLAQICYKWEKAAYNFESLGMRVICVRTGIVLGKGGGFLGQVLPLFKKGLGGKLGSGQQWFSWIYIDDLIRIYSEAINNKELQGPINAVSPGAVRNSDFTKELARVLNRPAVFTVPAFVLRFIMGEVSAIALMSQRVENTTLEKGFIKVKKISQALLKSI